MLISVDELAKVLSQTPSIVVVDVREQDEVVQTGVIPNARHIPLYELAHASLNIPTDSTVVCVCASGIRAELAVERFHMQGFLHVWNVLGGMKKWMASGYECVKLYGDCR